MMSEGVRDLEGKSTPGLNLAGHLQPDFLGGSTCVEIRRINISERGTGIIRRERPPITDMEEENRDGAPF